MSKPLIALASFALGVLFTLSVSFQESLLEAQGGMSGITLIGPKGSKAPGIVIAAAIPVVPSNPLYTLNDVMVSSFASQQLDGIRCVKCMFDNTTLTYGGGAVDLQNAEWSGTTHLRLVGAAANTEALLELMKGIEMDRIEPSDEVKMTIEKTITAKKPQNKVHFVAHPYPEPGTVIGPGGIQ